MVTVPLVDIDTSVTFVRDMGSAPFAVKDAAVALVCVVVRVSNVIAMPEIDTYAAFANPGNPNGVFCMVTVPTTDTDAVDAFACDVLRGSGVSTIPHVDTYAPVSFVSDVLCVSGVVAVPDLVTDAAVTFRSDVIAAPDEEIDSAVALVRNPGGKLA